MKLTRRAMSLSAGVLIAATGTLIVGGTGAQAAVSTPAPISTLSSQIAQSATVADFVADNPAPVVTSKDPAVFQKENDEAFDYWSKAPIAAMLGQWGCSASDINVAQQTGWDGINRATVSWMSDCSGESAPTPAQLTSARSATSIRAAASPASTNETTYGGCSSAGAYCIFGYLSNHALYFQYTNLFTSTFTGHVTAGEPGIGVACAANSSLGSTPNQAVAGGNTITLLTYAFYVDTQWSDTSVYSTGATRGHWCTTF